MNVLLLTDGIFPYVMGGMQKHSYYLARYLARNQVRVQLVHCVMEGEIPPSHGADESHFYSEELENIDFQCFRWPKADRLPGHYIRENKKYAHLIFEYFKEVAEEFDIIYGQGYTAWRFIQERKKGNLSVPIIVNFHGTNMYQKAPSLKIKLQHFLLRPPTKWNSVHADYVSSFGGVLTKINKRMGVEESRIIELPIGIEESWLEASDPMEHRKNSARTFVFIGRYERIKGVEELNQALQHLIDQEEAFKFHFIGPIPSEKRLQNERIVYHNKIVDQKKIQEILNQSDILVCPSHSEGMPTVILEGMAMGLAIIATRVGAIEKQIVGNGWLLEEVDAQKLTETLLTAIHMSEEQLTELKEKSVELIREKFLWDRVAQLNIQAFEKIIAKKVNEHA